MKQALIILISFFCINLFAQDNPYQNPVQTQSQLQVNQLLDKKSEYHRLTGGVQDGYRIKIHFGIDREGAEAMRVKFSNRFPDFITYKEYQQPNFVVVVGDYKTKLEAYELLKKIKEDYPYAFIVKSKVRPMKIN